MSQNQEEQMQFIKSSFANIACNLHTSKPYDQICSLKNCPGDKLLYCSKCLIEDEQHVTNHKIHFQGLEQFINSKITYISGLEFTQRLDYLKNQVNNLKSQLNTKLTNIKQKIYDDFSEILQNVQIYCQEIQKGLLEKIEEYSRKQIKQLDQLMSQISYKSSQHNSEKELILSEFVEILKNNFSFSNVPQLNTFLKKLNNKQTMYSAEPFSHITKETVEEIEFDYTSNPLYNEELVGGIKKAVFSQFEEPMQQNSFINFAPLKNNAKLHQSTKQISTPIELQQREYSDKLALLKSQYNQGSLAQKCILPTESKLSTNSIVIINNNTFVSSSNDEKIKIWQFSPNFIVNQFAAIETDGVCLNLRYNSLKKLLFAAMSNKLINVYDLADLSNIKLHKQLAGHARSVRGIAPVPSAEVLASVSYDQTVKLWDINKGAEVASVQMADDVRVMEASERFIVLGCKSGFIQALKIESLSKNEQGTIAATLSQPLPFKVSKERVTALCLGGKNDSGHLCLVGSYNGTFNVFNLETQQLIRKLPDLHIAAPISSINFFESADGAGFAVTTGWDKKINLIDLDSYQVLSNTKLALMTDESKHWATDSCKIIPVGDDLYYLLSIGNNDKRVQIFELKLQYEPNRPKQTPEIIVKNESQVYQH